MYSGVQKCFNFRKVTMCIDHILHTAPSRIKGSRTTPFIKHIDTGISHLFSIISFDSELVEYYLKVKVVAINIILIIINMPAK